MKKIAVVIGTRPNLIKYAAIERDFRAAFRIILIDTDQHYDDPMARNFYQEFRLAKPDYALRVGSGSPARQVGTMWMKTEEILLRERPEWVLVFGDTNSTLAGALAGGKAGIPIVHIEAGLRSFDRSMPEEVNRVVVDHLSSMYFCPTRRAVANLKREGIVRHVYLTGDLHEELLRRVRPTLTKRDLPASVQKLRQFAFLTLHRPENVDQPKKLRWIFSAIQKIDVPVIFAVHPRTKKMLLRARVRYPKHVLPFPPQAYRSSLALQQWSVCVFTDSGGIQRESAYLGTPCILFRERTEWQELVDAGNVMLAEGDGHQILRQFRQAVRRRPPPFRAFSNVSQKILAHL